MKVSNKKLKQLIKEELTKVLKERRMARMPRPRPGRAKLTKQSLGSFDNDESGEADSDEAPSWFPPDLTLRYTRHGGGRLQGDEGSTSVMVYAKGEARDGQERVAIRTTMPGFGDLYAYRDAILSAVQNRQEKIFDRWVRQYQDRATRLAVREFRAKRFSAGKKKG